MPQDKNLTIRKVKIPGITLYQSTYGVKFERKTEAYQNYREKVPKGKKEG
jgi:hypothetical protein